MSNYIYTNDGLVNADELAHYGVPGMRWGHRKQTLATSSTRKKFDSTKQEYKTAKKAYSKAYDKAYRYSARHPITQWASKKVSDEADRRWDKTIDAAKASNKAKQKYKQAKYERKQQIKDTYKDIQKKSTFGERFVYNDATRKKAAKYVVDNNMTVAEANKRAKKDAMRNTGIILAAIGAYGVAKYKNII